MIKFSAMIAFSGFSTVSLKKWHTLCHNITDVLLAKLVWSKMAGYWPWSFPFDYCILVNKHPTNQKDLCNFWTILTSCLVSTAAYYTTSSVSGQDEPNLALWLATWAGKMELSCLLGIRVMSRKEHLSCYGVLSRIINPLLTKLDRSKWLDIGLVLFLRVYGPRLRLDLANIQPSWPHAWSITHI